MYNHVDPDSDRPRWLQSHRPRLSLFANDQTKSPDPPVELDVSTGGVRATLTTWGVRWKRWLDVHLASSIFWRIFPFWPETGQQCNWWDGTCRSLGCAGSSSFFLSLAPASNLFHTCRSWRYFFVGKDPSGTSDRFKVALDVDGNAWSARFPRLMASKSLVIKSTAFTEWNAKTFPSWYGYLPSQNDYGDLESILSLCVCPKSVLSPARSGLTPYPPAAASTSLGWTRSRDEWRSSGAATSRVPSASLTCRSVGLLLSLFPVRKLMTRPLDSPGIPPQALYRDGRPFRRGGALTEACTMPRLSRRRTDRQHRKRS